jgi:DNA-binding NarL/FixJ family response regulator
MGLAKMLRFPPAQKKIRTRLAAFRKSGPVPYATLTRVETEVLDLVLQGRSVKAIAAQLGVNQGTVRTHLTKIFRKMHGLCAPYSA